MTRDKQVYGMVHVGALPGTPRAYLSIRELIKVACQEARILQSSGFHGLIIENMHDIPYLKREVGAEIIASLSVICAAVRQQVSIKMGLQVLAGANTAALAIAHSCELDFIRAEGYVYGQLSDEGFLESDAGKLQRYKRELNAPEIRIFCDIKKKHSSHAITADVSIGQTAEAAEFFLADGVIVTGSSTGKAANLADLKEVKASTSLPVWIGSGLTSDNLRDYWKLADGFVVGSYLKKEGLWQNPVCPDRCQTFIEQVNKLKSEER